MSHDLNLSQFIGRLGRDPETRYLANGDAVANFSIAVGESWKDKATGEKVEKTEWVRCVAFRQLAEIVGKYLTKGKQVYVSGKFTTRKWQDKEGKDQYTTEIVVDQMQMLGGGEGERQAPAAPQGRAAAVARPASRPEYGTDAWAAGSPATRPRVPPTVQGTAFDDMADDVPF